MIILFLFLFPISVSQKIGEENLFFNFSSLVQTVISQPAAQRMLMKALMFFITVALLPNQGFYRKPGCISVFGALFPARSDISQAGVTPER